MPPHHRQLGSLVRLVAQWGRISRDYDSDRHRPPQVARQSCTINGEANVLRPDGHSDFFALRGKDGQAIAVLVAFDLLELNGSDQCKLPIEDRRAKLARLLRSEPDGLIFSEAIAGDAPTVFAHACRLGRRRWGLKDLALVSRNHADDGFALNLIR